MGDDERGFSLFVPNAPCGVERSDEIDHSFTSFLFLMHRVELKVRIKDKNVYLALLFLMHRVELKEVHSGWNRKRREQFLMHRVELKVELTSVC